VNSAQGGAIVGSEPADEKLRRRVFPSPHQLSCNLASRLAQDVGRQREPEVALGEIAAGGEVEVDAGDFRDLVVVRSLL